MSKTSQRQIVASVTGWGDNSTRPYFAQVTGAEIQARGEKAYDGGKLFPETLPSPLEIGDITLSRHYDPDIDGPLMKTFRNQVGRARMTVSVFTMKDDLTNPAPERIYAEALLVGMTEPEGDSSSGTPTMFSLTFSCGAVANG